MRWLAAFYGMCLVTLVTIGVSNAIGVGHSWPFLAIGASLLVTVLFGVVAFTRPDKRERWNRW